MMSARCAVYERYKRRLVWAMSAYAVLVCAVPAVVVTTRPGPIVTGLLAVLPALPIVAVVAAIGRLLVEMGDEYQRARLVQHILWSTGVVLVASTLWGFVEAYGVAPHLPLYSVPMVWMSVMGVLSVHARITDR